MSKIDLYDPKWIDLVFQDKNKEYGAYQLRKGTSKRNLLALAILMAAAIIVGGYLIYKIEADKRAAERQAYMEQLELSKLQEQAEKEKKKEEKKIEKPKFEPKKEIPQVRETQKFTAPVIKKDELVKEDNQMKQMDQLDANTAVGVKDQEGTKDRTIEAARTDVVEKVQIEEPKQEVKQEVTQKIFDVVEQQPSFPGGQSALLSWLSSNIHYPPVAEENGIQGRVVVSFVVEPDGSISNVQVVRGVDPSLDKEAVRVTKAMPKWVPGKQNGQAVRVKYNLPVTFKLQ
ncbi:MAG: energy transducer TonB [Bacteroidaceae bacterium]|nr:energy transducer TonB [Bacteroidaceae bacterium]